jgi:lipid-binding SYLF domain-containing protein
MNTTRHIMAVNGVWQFQLVIILSAALMLSQPTLARANDREEATQIVEKSCMTVDNFAHDKNFEAFKDLLKKAKAVVIAPSLLKGAFVLGVSGGNAVAMVRNEKTGRLSEPAFYTIGGVSYGLQIGGESSEVILLAMTDRGANALLENSLKLGADVGVAAGPFGLGVQAASANLSADVLSFSRSKGLYGGISFDGAVIAVRESLNQAFYNDPRISSTDILIRNSGRNPETACLLGGLTKIAKLNESRNLTSGR